MEHCINILGKRSNNFVCQFSNGFFFFIATSVFGRLPEIVQTWWGDPEVIQQKVELIQVFLWCNDEVF